MEQPYLIQRAKKASSFDYQQGSTISDAVSLEYMGSSEFEFGALPQSLRKMNAVASELEIKTLDSIIDSKGKPLLVLGSPEIIEDAEYEAVLVEFSRGEGPRTKGSVGLDDAVSPSSVVYPSRRMNKADKKIYEDNWNNNRTAFWWDLDNDVMMTFEPELMTNLKGHLAASWQKMELPVPENFAEPAAAESPVLR